MSGLKPVAPTFLIPTPSSHPNPVWLKNMDYVEFIALCRDCRWIGRKAPAATAKLLPEQCILQCTGRLSAQVALLQSPILSAAPQRYFTKTLPRNPVDKPHT